MQINPKEFRPRSQPDIKNEVLRFSEPSGLFLTFLDAALFSNQRAIELHAELYLNLHSGILEGADLLEEMLDEALQEALEEEDREEDALADELYDEDPDGLEEREPFHEEWKNGEQDLNSDEKKDKEQETLEIECEGDGETENKLDFCDLNELIRNGQLETLLTNHQQSRPLLHKLINQIMENAQEDIHFLISFILQHFPSLSSESHALLEEVLYDLFVGHSPMLDQHLLAHLDQRGWFVLFSLIPPRYFSGLAQPLAHIDFDELVNYYEIWQSLIFQNKLSHAQQERLTLLYQHNPAFATGKQSAYQLEKMKQYHLFPPGPIGALMRVALKYPVESHVPQMLLLICHCYLTGSPLSKLELLSQVLYEQCYPRELTEALRIQTLIQRVLEGYEPTLEEILLLLQGSGNRILSYLPFHQVCGRLQDTIQFVYTHPRHIEESNLWRFL